MKYLSDLLYVDIPTSLFAGEYKTYNVRLIRPSIEGSAFDDNLTYVDNYETIYTGTIYGTGNTERIYLNDIIASYVYDNSYAMGPKTGELNTPNVYNENPMNVIFQCDVYVVGMFAKSVADGEMILNMYKDPKIPRYDIYPLDEIVGPIIFNTLTTRTKVYPRIPNLSADNPTDNFWFAGLFIASHKWLAASHNASGHEIWFMGTKYTGDSEITKSTVQCRTYGHVFGISLKNTAYWLALNPKTSIGGEPHSLYLMPYSLNNANAVKIAEIDNCPAPYYLIWIDRSGAYQCQPLEGKCTLSESIATSYRVNAIDESIPYNKTVTNQWKLNSGWLNYDQYKAYESIMTSKYLYLYDTENDEGHEVVIDTNEWTEKTQKNKDKAFNLQIDVHATRPQNILY